MKSKDCVPKANQVSGTSAHVTATAATVALGVSALSEAITQSAAHATPVQWIPDRATQLQTTCLSMTSA